MNGQFLLDIKRQYLTNLGNVPGSTYETLEAEKLETKLEICREYLKMLNSVHPGCNYVKRELNSPLKSLIKNMERYHK